MPDLLVRVSCTIDVAFHGGWSGNDFFSQPEDTATEKSFTCAYFKFWRNKAGYTATPVACGWAGAVIEVTRSFGQEQWSQKSQKPKKSKVWRTDGQTDGPMDGPTKRGVESRSTRLKTELAVPTLDWRLFISFALVSINTKYSGNSI